MPWRCELYTVSPVYTHSTAASKNSRGGLGQDTKVYRCASAIPERHHYGLADFTCLDPKNKHYACASKDDTRTVESGATSSDGNKFILAVLEQETENRVPVLN
jgi:hypothetical protein